MASATAWMRSLAFSLVRAFFMWLRTGLLAQIQQASDPSLYGGRAGRGAAQTAPWASASPALPLAWGPAPTTCSRRDGGEVRHEQKRPQLRRERVGDLARPVDHHPARPATG